MTITWYCPVQRQWSTRASHGVTANPVTELEVDQRRSVRQARRYVRGGDGLARTGPDRPRQAFCPIRPIVLFEQDLVVVRRADGGRGLWGQHFQDELGDFTPMATRIGHREPGLEQCGHGFEAGAQRGVAASDETPEQW